ncbi:polyprenyl glycosylphosphotransferase [Sphingomonas ginkgonis]|uniref:Polyprenyl glycosylphosphotransferase n=1 Tax=Sphingomonas ginkgonis TaxID=2315330 RepID=A0A429V908_9SPHN|nr:sugar transferase [Sphingomonas ginkgonis]RST30461.1 polyprenyl glycosylphosphotransferase [Sphingomonas ginkgonis]
MGMLQVVTRQTVKRRSIVTRRRFQLFGALLLAALLPFLVRQLVQPEAVLPDVRPAFNAMAGNAIGIIIGFWMRLSIEPYPGIRSSYVIFPTAAGAHAVVLAFFLLTRMPYDRTALLFGFMLHVAWFYLVYYAVQRRASLSIAVIPYGNVARLAPITSVEWVRLSRPDLDACALCDAIVADFAADLPDEWERFLADAALDGRIVYQVKNLEESLTGRVEIDHLSENSFGSLVPARGYFYLKTLLDWLLAVAVLPFALLVMIPAAIAIKLEGGGPALFRQKRIGHAARPITVIKFRTMRIGSGPQDARAAAMTGDKDPRVTRVGAFLRKTRIDEVPQIFNVLKGEMSWIGPRPEAAVLSQWYTGEIPFYRYRHVVKPGISGWAQVNQGHVAEVEEVHEKLQFDFYYIKYFSPWLDVLILFKTLKTMASGFGAR